jgi:methylated-DNA-[protein]-cysteine S-methyltransferase
MWTETASPVGPLTLVARGGTLVAIDFDAVPDAPPSQRSSVQVAAARAAGRAPGERDDDDPVLGEAARQLAAYFAGRLTRFDLPLDPDGTPFQRAVWESLRAIPYGETRTYGELAHELGLGGRAARAVGLANGRNPVPIVVPCHRVVGAGGRLTGYGGGLARKRALLDLEQGALFGA